MEKYDVYKVHKEDYVSPNKPVLLTLKPAPYLAVDGEGAPGSPRFQAAVQALYVVAYTMKFTKKAAGQDFKVPGFEGLWWPKDGKFEWGKVKPEDWQWKLIMRLPEFITEKDVAEAIATALRKGKPETIKRAKLEMIDEGRSVQMLHVGPYDKEKETVDAMDALAASQGLSFKGPHHEIYLSDPRRVKPEKLRTILRHPVKK